MLDSYFRFEVPADLAAYYRVTNVLNRTEDKNNVNFCSDLVIERDDAGCVASIKYYTPDRELSKEVCYKGSEICKINHYRGGILYSEEVYQDGYISLKNVYLRNGNLVHTYEYEHGKKGEVLSICKKSDGREILAVYKYDDFGRIVKRRIFLNSEKVLEQHYGYDILDRITAYTDDNQRIVVSKLGKKNELISYVITDKMGNNIKIDNDFIGQEYRCTRITLNGHCSTVKNTSYVDNVMLKKPYTSEDDLDLIIANLFGSAESLRTARDKSLENHSTEMIEKNIEMRTLPISIRKRLMYNKAAKVS